MDWGAIRLQFGASEIQLFHIFSQMLLVSYSIRIQVKQSINQIKPRAILLVLLARDETLAGPHSKPLLLANHNWPLHADERHCLAHYVPEQRAQLKQGETDIMGWICARCMLALASFCSVFIKGRACRLPPVLSRRFKGKHRRGYFNQSMNNTCHQLQAQRGTF